MVLSNAYAVCVCVCVCVCARFFPKTQYENKLD